MKKNQDSVSNLATIFLVFEKEYENFPFDFPEVEFYISVSAVVKKKVWKSQQKWFHIHDPSDLLHQTEIVFLLSDR